MSFYELAVRLSTRPCHLRNVTPDAVKSAEAQLAKIYKPDLATRVRLASTTSKKQV